MGIIAISDEWSNGVPHPLQCPPHSRFEDNVHVGMDPLVSVLPMCALLVLGTEVCS